jgi:pimeloyl-ACP methyl ester carboxylesterase
MAKASSLAARLAGCGASALQDVLEQDEAVGAEHGPGGEQGRQPRMAPHDRARLVAEVEEVGEPVTGRRREDVLRTRGVDHRIPGPPARSPRSCAGTPPAYTAEDITDDAVAVLDALGWDSAHLFGHSMGGQLAQRIALRHPGRVRSITSSASLPGDVGRLGAARYVRVSTVARLARMKFPEGHDGDIELAVAATRAIASSAYPADEQEVRRMAERDQASGIRDTAAQSRQAGAKWHGGRLSQLRVPALVLHGAQDPLLRPAAARRTAAAIRGARLVILPGIGHYLPATVYPQVADEVRALADRAAPAAPKPS